MKKPTDHPHAERLEEKILLVATEMLPVPLTDAERLAFGDRVAQLRREADAVDSDLAEAKAAAKAKLEKNAADTNYALDCIQRREEDRPIETHEVAFVEQRRVDLIRTDTGAVVRTRPMTGHEVERLSQRELKLVDPARDIGTQGSPAAG